METISLVISSCLDNLGYNDDMVKYRRVTYQRIQNTLNSAPLRNGFETLIEDDLSEILQIKNNVLCISASDINFKLGEKQTKLVADRRRSPPGYAILLSAKSSTGHVCDDDVFHSTFGQSRQMWGVYYFNKMKDNFGQNMFWNRSQTFGPALHTNRGNFNFPLILIDTDAVSKVKRKLKLPQVIQEVCPAEGFVFPDSSSGSDLSHLEWRISYTRTEQRLFRAFNVTQIKLYVLLKMIGESTLYEISNEMNSYVMKNIVFWTTYLCKPEDFQEEHLVSLLIAALGILYNCVKTGFIPCFMTEERNLLAKPLEAPRKHDLLQMLNILHQEKACMLLRCEKIKCVMMMKFKSPHIIDMYQRQRNRLEQLVLELELIETEMYNPKDDSPKRERVKIVKEMFDMVLPEWKELSLEGVNAQDIFKIVSDRTREILGLSDELVVEERTGLLSP